LLIARSAGDDVNIYPITWDLANAYHGTGWALVAILNGHIVAIRYIDELADVTLPDQLDGDHAAFFARQWLQTKQAAPVVRELQVLGQVSVGMCKDWKFTEL
jgi:hypothetical protein